MQVVELWRYPVKSMAGERMQDTLVGASGVAGDRAWALRQDNVTRNAKKFPGLMGLSASYREEPPLEGVIAPVILLADGTTIDADHPDVSALLGGLVGADVTLCPVPPASNLDFFRRRERRTLAESRAIFGLIDGEPYPDVSRFPPSVAEFATPPGTFFDCFPLLVMTTASLAALAAAAPDSIIDVRRFRPNILIDCDQTGFVEQDWIGRTLCIGDLELSIDVPCPRCVMTTIGFHDLPKDPRIMRSLVQTCHHELGVYATAQNSSRIAVGDVVTLT